MVSTKLKSIMKMKKVSHAQMARDFGMSPQSFNNKLSRNFFTADELIAYLDYLGCKLVVVPDKDWSLELTMDDIRK